MLKIKGLIVVLLLISGLISLPENVYSQGSNTEQVEITVLGNCAMCKDRIERAAYSVRGVRRADWDNKEQKLTLTYRTDRTELATIERAIAKAGHDTENFLADDETYANMHHCCVYKRDPKLLEKNKVWNEE